jgi:hypothetical protein
MALATFAGAAPAATLPEDRSEVMFHSYDGGGVKATGPAVLVRKSLANRVSLSGGVYVDAVSNASIDVVTTASPYKETRNAYDLGAELLVRDSLVSVGINYSKEPDYIAQTASLDVSHEVFGGMTTVAIGFSRAADKVGRKFDTGFFDKATHWQYRAGITQILTPRWLASVNVELSADDGFLGSPYRSARVFGAAVPERNPRTRTGRAVKLRTLHETGSLWAGSSLRAEYRYYWDTWAIKAQTVEIGGAKRFGERWIVDAAVRSHSQDKALFFYDNAQAETTYVSRNRQLSTFTNTSFLAKASYEVRGLLPKGYEMKLAGIYELKRFRFKDFTDSRTGSPYRYDADIVQVLVSLTY